MSGVEFDFMVRQDNLGDLSNFSTQSHFSLGNRNHEKKVPGPSDFNFNSSNKVHDLLPVYENNNDALKERIILLEKQVSTLTATIERKESEQEKTENRLKRTFTELESYKRAYQTEISQLDNKHEQAILLLKEHYLREMALMTSVTQPSRNVLQDNNNGNGNGGGNMTDNNGSEGHKQLLQQLDYMRAEQRRMEENFTEERKLFQAENNVKILAQERILKVEITDLRRQRTVLEDRITQLSDDFTVIHAKSDSLVQQNKQLELIKDEAIEGQNKLRIDLKALQKSGTAAFRLDSSNAASLPGSKNISGSVGVDYETTIRLNEAKADAKIRQLTNKLDFLKAQLSSEQSSSEDLKLVAIKEKSKVDELRVEFRLKMQEADVLKTEAVEIAEKQLESIYTERMQEFTSLQAKTMTIQGQLQIAYQDTATAKAREETARVASSKAIAQQIALRTEIDNLREQLQALRDEKEAEVSGLYS